MAMTTGYVWHLQPDFADFARIAEKKAKVGVTLANSNEWIGLQVRRGDSTVQVTAWSEYYAALKAMKAKYGADKIYLATVRDLQGETCAA